MKKQILYTLIFFFPIIAQSQWVNKWEKVNIPDRYSNEAYLDVFFLPSDPNYGWICGFSSQVSYTKDGGKTWQTTRVSSSGTIVQLESIHFVSERIGFTSGSNTMPQDLPGAIYRTDDGGENWKNITPILPKFVSLWGCYFYDENNGYAVGGECDEQYFLKTTDGGDSWNLKNYNAKLNSKLSDIKVDGKTGLGYAISSGLVWRTEDYGENWEIEFQTGPSDWHEELAYLGDSFIIPYDESCAGSQSQGRGGVLFTTDRGKSFEELELSLGTPMYGSFLIDENTGWACGFNRSVYFTCDAGNNWELLNCGIEGNLDDIFFINDTTGWVVGDEVFKTRNVTDVNKVISVDTIRVCEGETVDLKIDSSQKYLNYNWSNCGFGEASFSVGEGNYRVYAYNDPCDTAYIYDYVVQYYNAEKPSIISNSPDNICEGDTIELSISQNYSNILWNTGDTTRTIDVTESGNYIVEISSSDGCVRYDTLVVEFSPLPRPNIIPKTPNNFCIGDSIILESEFVHSEYNWISPNGNSISFDKIIAAKDSGEYYLIATNEFGCIDTSDKFTVEVRNDSNRISINYTNVEPFVFDTLTLSRTLCQKIKVTNSSNGEYLLNNIKLLKKYYFALAPSSLPILLKPFETVELDICFSGDSTGNFEDGVEITDVCSPHLFKISGEVKPFEIDLISNCDVPWKFTSVRLDKDYVFESSSPYPNPSNGDISLDFMEFTPADKRAIALKLYDSKGNYLTNLERRVSEVSYHKNGTLEKGKYSLEINLKQGVYFIVVEGVSNQKAKPIVITY